MAYERTSCPTIQFDQLTIALKTVGLSSKDIDIVFQRIAAILHLGNVTFEEDSNGFAKISDDANSQESLDIAGILLDTDAKHLEFSLLNRDIQVNSSNIV